jgi:transposase InsO family protein
MKFRRFSDRRHVPGAGRLLQRLLDAALMERIGAVHAASHGTYGSPRVHAELVESGLSIKRVARLMKAAGLAGVSCRRL